MKARSLLLWGLAVFLVTALLHLPAGWLHRAASPALAPSGVQLGAVSGTLSQGTLGQVLVRGQLLTRDLHWDLHALQLLLGRASVHVAGGGDGVLIDGTVYALPSGALGVSDLRLGAPARSVLVAAGQGLFPVEGQLGAQIEHLRLREGWPQSAQGTLTVRGLGWKLGREVVVLGDYEARVEDDTDGLKASLRSLAGPLEASGEVRTRSDRSYELRLQMRPRPDAPPMVVNLVRNLGQPDAQGWYHLSRRGQVPSSGAAR